MTSNVDDFSRKLRDLGKRVEKLAGKEHDVPFDQLFTPCFMQRYTDVATFEDLLAAGGFTVETPADFAAMPDAEWEQLIRSRTRFKSWEAMQRKAAEEWAAKQMRF